MTRGGGERKGLNKKGRNPSFLAREKLSHLPFTLYYYYYFNFDGNDLLIEKCVFKKGPTNYAYIFLTDRPL